MESDRSADGEEVIKNIAAIAYAGKYRVILSNSVLNSNTSTAGSDTVSYT
jgi:hypothetical protein